MRDGNDASGGGGSRYISRLECIKEAVTRHLDHLAAERPNCQVHFIISSYVMVFKQYLLTDCYCVV